MFGLEPMGEDHYATWRAASSDADEVVGHAWFTPETRPIGRVAFIYDIGVDEAHRGRGHARAAPRRDREVGA
jgi:ribosomal protein S18 acetylase RimI-like enzyme